jgi:DNA invertase Pin-like site-specific DNA recombinase
MIVKLFVVLARVSSREQEREGFSLDVQESALKAYADKHGGTMLRLFRIAETASKKDERKTFREMVAFAKKRSLELDGLLFYKVDRAARNLVDYVELERLESEYNVPFISASQPTESSPAGRMMRRILEIVCLRFQSPGPPRRRKPLPHNEKALRRTRRRASRLVKSRVQNPS